MSAPTSNSPERLWELLADDATHGLSAHEKEELSRLLEMHPNEDAESFQRAAAALDVAMFAGSRSNERMPEWVRRSIPMPSASGLGQQTRLRLSAVDAESSFSPVRHGNSVERRGGWGWVAAAACAALAITGWWSKLSDRSSAGPGGGGSSIVVSSDAVSRFRQTTQDVQVAAWTKGKDETAAVCSGEVLWSPSKQEGYMVFRGLASNDPSKEQYQLWIFDPERDERFPVHGGVFNIPGGQQEVVVKITPKLGVPRATTFVVTVERPGGVWVSDRSRIPVLATVGK